jgi:hypothetical protein
MKDLNEKSTVSTVAKINNTEIVVIENGEKRVAIKPICDALGVAYQGQIDKIKTDEILGTTIMLSMTVGADGKDREMQTIPFKFVFGWLFTINPKNVSPAAKEAVIKFKLECYNALYNHFTRQAEFLQQRQNAVDALLEQYDDARRNFKDAEKIMREKKSELDTVRSVTFHEWLSDQSQLSLFNPKEMEG